MVVNLSVGMLSLDARAVRAAPLHARGSRCLASSSLSTVERPPPAAAPAVMDSLQSTLEISETARTAGMAPLPARHARPLSTSCVAKATNQTVEQV